MRGIRFAALPRRGQNALRKQRLEWRIKRREEALRKGMLKPGMLTPEWLYMRKNTAVPEGLKRSKLADAGARILSKKWFNVEKEKFLAEKGSNPQAGMTMRQRIHGRAFRNAEIKRQIAAQKKFAFNLIAQHLPDAERRAFLNKWLSRGLRTISTRELVRYRTAPEIRTETLDNLSDLRLDKRMSGGYTHTETWRDYLHPGFWEMSPGLRTSAAHEAIHQARAEFGARALADVPWAQAIDRFYGLANGLAGIDRRIGAPNLKDFNREQRYYRDPKIALEKEPNWTYTVGNKIGQWAFEKLGEEKGANYLFLRVWGRSHNEALDIVNNNRMHAVLAQMRREFAARKNA